MYVFVCMCFFFTYVAPFIVTVAQSSLTNNKRVQILKKQATIKWKTNQRGSKEREQL